MDKIIRTGMGLKVLMIQDVPVLKMDHAQGKIILDLQFVYYECILKIFIYSVSGYDILCNCDDQKTGLTDDNVLRSMDQLPVKGNVSNVNFTL